MLKLVLQTVNIDEDGCHEADLGQVFHRVAFDGVPFKERARERYSSSMQRMDVSAKSTVFELSPACLPSEGQGSAASGTESGEI